MRQTAVTIRNICQPRSKLSDGNKWFFVVVFLGIFFNPILTKKLTPQIQKSVCF